MENPQIKNFVITQLQSGLTAEDVTGQLRAAGWSEEAITQAFAAAQSSIAPAAVPTTVSTESISQATAQSNDLTSNMTQSVQSQSTERQVLPEPIKRGRMKTGWLLFTQSLRVIKHNSELMRYVVISMLLTLIILSVSVAVAIYDSEHSQILYQKTLDSDGETALSPTLVGVIVDVAVVYLMTIITYFYGVALSSHVLAIFHGKQTHYREHIAVARKKIVAILVLALITCVIGYILRFIEERVRFVGWIVARILGAAWALATTFTIPVIADGDDSGMRAISHSIGLFKQTWGETVTSRIAVGGFVFLLYFGVGIPLFLVLMIGFTVIIGVWGAIIAILLFILGVVILAILQSLATNILNTSLYYYARYGVIPPSYSPELLASVFVAKKSKKAK